MRPVKKPSVPPLPEGLVNVGHLFNALGPYCSTCEIPLPGLAYIWHPRKGVLPTEVAPAEDWHEALVLCRNCAAAAAAAPPAPSAHAGEFRPDQDLTFKVAAASPFSYLLQPAEHQLLHNETGAPQGDPQSVPLVIVRAASPEAQATLDRFALNTPYFDPASNTVRIPQADHEQLVDRRLDLRGDAWRQASEIAALLAEAKEPVLRNAIISTAHRLAGAIGFWSVWATVLWAKHQDRALLADILMPGGARAMQQSAAVTEAVETTATPPPAAAGHFTGTRSDWLP